VLRTPVRIPVAPRTAWRHVKSSSTSVQFWKFVVADASAALFGVPLAFGLAYVFTDQIKAIMVDVRRAERWLGLAGPLAIAVMLVVVVRRGHRRVGTECLDEEPTEGHSPPP
jgi:hypothetical protein